MKFHVGYQKNRRLKETLLANSDKVAELYFGWGGFATGRGEVISYQDQIELENDLKEYNNAGIALNLLLNGNCYGASALSRKFFNNIGDTIDHIITSCSLHSVTTTSPVIAGFIRDNFPALQIRASVNMEIGTPEAVEFLLDKFDSFYLKREYNHNFKQLQLMKECCKRHGKQLLLLANSGCLNFCPARTFHDNLVAHQHQIAEMDNAFDFHGLCHEYLSSAENKKNLLSLSNFIRPEDVEKYEDICDGMKLATRTNPNPAAIAYAYFNNFWHGNLLELTEPAHARHFFPEVILNDRFPAGYAEKRMHCDKNCGQCGYCSAVQSDATVKFNDDFSIPTI